MSSFTLAPTLTSQHADRLSSRTYHNYDDHATLLQTFRAPGRYNGPDLMRPQHWMGYKLG